MSIEIREATQEDYVEILGLIKELADFENSTDKVINTVEQMIEESEYFGALVATDNSKDNQIIGMALYFYAYYTWVGKSLYLDDLYVKSEYRKQGVGKKLIEAVLAVAKEAQCKRVRWQALNWNENAINFYKKLGANLDDEWVNCDLHKGQF